MAVLEGGVSAALTGVGLEAASPLHVTNKPVPYGALGHYCSTVRFALVNSQAANSRLWQIRNTSATNLIVVTRLEVRWQQTAAHTAAILDQLALYKLTGFTAVDTTNTVTPTVSLRRTSMGATTAAIRHVTVAGVAAGMTGGTLTKDTNAAMLLEQWLLLAQPTAGPVTPMTKDLLDNANGTHPFVLVQNEGLGLENVVALGAAAGSSVTVDLSYAEVTAF